MTVKEILIKEIEQTSENLLPEVLDFLHFLKIKYQQETFETTLISEAVLQKDWLQAQEDEAWQNL